jgi:hypothetical protein
MIFAAWKRESDSNLANCIGSPLSGPQSITVAVKTSPSRDNLTKVSKLLAHAAL